MIELENPKSLRKTETDISVGKYELFPKSDKNGSFDFISLEKPSDMINHDSNYQNLTRIRLEITEVINSRAISDNFKKTFVTFPMYFS